MKLRELMALLAKFDPDDTVVIDPGCACLLLLNHRPGMSQPVYEDDDQLQLTELDKNLLRAMQVRF